MGAGESSPQDQQALQAQRGTQAQAQQALIRAQQYAKANALRLQAAATAAQQNLQTRATGLKNKGTEFKQQFIDAGQRALAQPEGDLGKIMHNLGRCLQESNPQPNQPSNPQLNPIQSAGGKYKKRSKTKRRKSIKHKKTKRRKPIKHKKTKRKH